MANNRKPTPEELKSMLDVLYRTQAVYLVELAQACGCSFESAEDVVQDTFKTALDQAEGLYRSPNRKSWLILVLRQQIIRHFLSKHDAHHMQQDLQVLYSNQREGRRKRDPEPAPVSSDLLSVEEISLLNRFYVDRRPIAALADELHISEETCRERLHTAALHFQKAYKENIEHPE